MKKLLFSLVAIAALQMSFMPSSNVDNTCLEEESLTGFINCLEARRNATRQRDQIIANGGSVTNANRAYCIIWSRSTNGQCGPCKYQ